MTVLEAAGIEYTERPALTVRMDHVPGAGAVAFRKLAKAGVNGEGDSRRDTRSPPQGTRVEIAA